MRDEYTDHYRPHEPHGPHGPHGPGRRGASKMMYLHLVEIVTIVLSYLGRSRIARFLTAKISMDVVVEVTARFGKPAGHRLSTVLSLIVAEPRLIAVIVTGMWIIINILIWTFRRIRYERYLRRRGKYPGGGM